MIANPLYKMRQNGVYLLFTAILFLLSPLLACGFIMFIAFYTNDRRYVKPLLFLLPLLIFFVQMTRHFSTGEIGDWPGYAIRFHEASKMSFINYLLSYKPSEFGWRILNYVGNIITLNNFRFFSSIIVAATFGISGLAVYKFWRHTNTDIRFLVASLSMCFFFNEFIGISNNLLRMQFAMSMMAYAIVARYTDEKVIWWLVISSLIIHNGVLLLIPFLFLRSSHKLRIKQFAYIFLFVVGFTVVLSICAKYFTGSSLYLLRQISKSYTEGTSIKNTDVISVSAVYFFSAIVVLCYIKVIFIDKTQAPWRIEIYNFAALFCIFCILLSNMPLVVTRFYISRFFFMPLFLPYLFIKKNDAVSILYLAGIFFFFYFRFCLYHTSFIDIPEKVFGEDVLGIIQSYI